MRNSHITETLLYLLVGSGGASLVMFKWYIGFPLCLMFMFISSWFLIESLKKQTIEEYKTALKEAQER